ncbi:MAG: class I SAM-dependent methyltransferase [Pyrinomonadaceae bacterium]
MANESSYDQIPYPSFTFSQAHPDRLSTMAEFHGINSAPAESCRVLELGCGDGTNLLWCASTLPNSKFVGIDLSAVHIEKAVSGASELNLSNTSFHHGDLLDFDTKELGQFDYIVAHGLFSWVPDIVRKKILQIYADCLSPHGVGYISFNAYPGCHIRQMVGDMMKFHIRGIENPVEKLSQSRAIINFITNTAETGSVYQYILKEELDTITSRSDSGVIHDDLSEFNDPFYFHEFVEQISDYGFQYLCEAKSSSEHTANLSAEAKVILDQLGGDRLRREQYIDFITGRRFRWTLICREDISLNQEQNPELINKFFIASQLSPVSKNPDIRSAGVEKFIAKDGSSVEARHPFTKAALVQLNINGNRETNFQDLVERCIELCGIEDKSGIDTDISKTAIYLLEMFKAGFVYLRRRKTELAYKAGEFPEASQFARWQIERGSEAIRTLSGVNIKVDDPYIVGLLRLLDGKKDRSQLALEMSKLFIENGAKPERLGENLTNSIERILSRLAETGLLVK